MKIPHRNVAGDDPLGSGGRVDAQSSMPPRRLVYDAFTQPELLKRWFGPRGWSLVVCEVDLRVGGAWRYVLRGPDGKEMGMSGVYRELALLDRLRPHREVRRLPGRVGGDHGLRVEEHGQDDADRTRFSAESKEIRDAVISSGMEHGAAETYDKPGRAPGDARRVALRLPRLHPPFAGVEARNRRGLGAYPDPSGNSPCRRAPRGPRRRPRIVPPARTSAQAPARQWGRSASFRPSQAWSIW